MKSSSFDINDSIFDSNLMIHGGGVFIKDKYTGIDGKNNIFNC